MSTEEEEWVVEAVDVDAAETDSSDDDPDLFYDSLDTFVREYLVKVFRRKIDGDGAIWRANWWEYPEAVIRLSALWRSWESMRLDPATGMSDWLRLHADHHMPLLMSPHGPFAGSGNSDEQNTSKAGAPLPYAPLPVGLRVG